MFLAFCCPVFADVSEHCCEPHKGFLTRGKKKTGAIGPRGWEGPTTMSFWDWMRFWWGFIANSVQWAQNPSRHPCPASLVDIWWASLGLVDARRTLPAWLHCANCKIWWRRDNGILCYFSGVGVGPLLQVKGNFNASAYQDILDNAVFPNLWEQFGEGLFLFQHDCAPVHKAKSIWLACTKPWSQPHRTPLELTGTKVTSQASVPELINALAEWMNAQKIIYFVVYNMSAQTQN